MLHVAPWGWKSSAKVTDIRISGYFQPGKANLKHIKNWWLQKLWKVALLCFSLLSYMTSNKPLSLSLNYETLNQFNLIYILCLVILQYLKCFYCFCGICCELGWRKKPWLGRTILMIIVLLAVKMAMTMKTQPFITSYSEQTQFMRHCKFCF